jgi:hypothetical protein
MALYVPYLSKKLECLYQRHEMVNTHKQLANYLGVAANNISVWIWGNPMRLAGLLPNRHVRKICDLYGIKARWLEVESIEEFKTLLDLDTLARLDLTTMQVEGPAKTFVSPGAK